MGQPALAAGARPVRHVRGWRCRPCPFSDVLGNHNLVTGLQVNGSFKDFSGLVAYENLTHRVELGEWSPSSALLTGGFRRVYRLRTATAFVEQQLLQRQTNRDL